MPATHGETPLGLASLIMNIAGVLTQKAALTVSRFQRPFSWTEREVRQLIQDLRRAYLRSATFYFIGQIVLVKGSHNQLEVSDGQQRLATLTMIVAYVRDRLPHRVAHYQSLIMLNDGRGEPRLRIRDADASFFHGNVQEPGNMARMAEERDETGSDSKDLLIAAAKTISTELNDMSDRELDQFMSYVIRCTTLNVIYADERGSAATIYNTTNTRGLELSAADNIKCELLEHSGLSPKEADAAALQWEELESRAGREHFAKLLITMPFLLMGEELISPGDLGAFRACVESAGGVRSFLFEQLPRYAHAQKQIMHGAVDVGSAPVNADINRRLHLMRDADDWPWAPAALAFLAGKRGPPESARKFFQALDRFQYGCEFSVIDNRVRAKRFAAAARHAGDDAVFLPGGPLDLSSTEREKFIERLNRSSKKDRLRRLMVLRLEAALPGGSILSVHDDATVEHIMPRGAVPWWTERCPDKRMRDDACGLLGNLTLITEEQNQLADAESFPVKYKIFFDPKYPLHKLTKGLAGASDWTIDIIYARHEELVRILCGDWDLNVKQQ